MHATYIGGLAQNEQETLQHWLDLEKKSKKASMQHHMQGLRQLQFVSHTRHCDCLIKYTHMAQDTITSLPSPFPSSPQNQCHHS
jgi:hypothetical protein